MAKNVSLSSVTFKWHSTRKKEDCWGFFPAILFPIFILCSSGKWQCTTCKGRKFCPRQSNNNINENVKLPKGRIQCGSTPTNTTTWRDENSTDIRKIKIAPNFARLDRALLLVLLFCHDAFFFGATPHPFLLRVDPAVPVSVLML